MVDAGSWITARLPSNVGIVTDRIAHRQPCAVGEQASAVGAICGYRRCAGRTLEVGARPAPDRRPVPQSDAGSIISRFGEIDRQRDVGAGEAAHAVRHHRQQQESEEPGREQDRAQPEQLEAPLRRIALAERDCIASVFQSVGVRGTAAWGRAGYS